MQRLLSGALGAMLVLSAPAAAAPDCATPLPAPQTILSGQGVLESAIVDAGGRLFYTDSSAKALMRLDRPGAAPVVVAGVIESPGGLAFHADGDLLVGEGNGFVNGIRGNVDPVSRLLKVDPDSGVRSVFASGLAMANGLVSAADGTLYASDDAGIGIDRISADGTVVTPRFASIFSSNGLAIDSTGRWLYAAQTFRPAQIARIDLRDPTKVSAYATAAPLDWAAGPDGMAIDRHDRLTVAANGGGQVWRVNTDRSICVLGRGLLLPSAVAFGRGTQGFSAGRLFVVTFSGVVAEVPAGYVA